MSGRSPDGTHEEWFSTSLMQSYLYECSALTAGVMKELFRHITTVEDAIVSLWMASKFEEIWPIEVRMLPKYNGESELSYREACRREIDILCRLDWTIPFRSKVRSIHESLQRDNTFVRDCMYVALFTGFDDYFDVDAWKDALERVNHPILQCMFSLLKVRRLWTQWMPCTFGRVNRNKICDHFNPRKRKNFW